MRKLIMLLLIVVLIASTLVIAQDDWETFTLTNGATIDYPTELTLIQSCHLHQ